MAERKKIIAFILRLSVSAGLLIVLFTRVDMRSLTLAVKNADKIILLVAFLALFLDYLLAFLRWQMLIKAYGIEVSISRLAVSYSAGLFFNALLPSTIGGDLARSFDLGTFAKKIRRSIATVILDRLSGYVGVILVVLPAVFLKPELLQDKLILLSVIAMVAIFIVVVMLLFNRAAYLQASRFLGFLKLGRFSQSLKDLHQDMHDLAGLPRSVIPLNLIVSVFIQGIGPIVFYFIALALGIKVNILYYLIYIPLVGVITLLPVSIGGLGLRDATIVFLFARLGVPQDAALAMSLLFFAFSFIYATLGGIVYVFSLRTRRI